MSSTIDSITGCVWYRSNSSRMSTSIGERPVTVPRRLILCAVRSKLAHFKVARSSRSTSLLHFAAQNNHVAIMAVLLDAGADSNIRTRDAFTPLLVAATNSGGSIVVTMLLNADADAKVRGGKVGRRLALPRKIHLSEKVTRTAAQGTASTENPDRFCGTVCRAHLRPGSTFRTSAHLKETLTVCGSRLGWDGPVWRCILREACQPTQSAPPTDLESRPSCSPPRSRRVSGW